MNLKSDRKSLINDLTYEEIIELYEAEKDSYDYDDVMSDMFPNATSPEEPEYELDCWNN